MLKDIYHPIDKDSELYLNNAQELLDSPSFLSGLGKFNHQCPIPDIYNVIADFERADYLMNSQLMWGGSYQTESGDQFFHQILTGAVSIDGTEKYSSEESLRRLEPTYVDSNELDNYLTEVVERAYERNGIRNSLFSLFEKPDSEGIQKHLDTNYPSIVFMCVTNYIRAGYFGGTDIWPVGEHLFNSLATGGVPTGWVGALPENGGNAKDCLQIIHFGPKIKLAPSK